MIKSKIILNVGSSLLIGWIFFEYIIDKENRRKLKKKVLNMINHASSDKFKEYYSKNISDINNEILDVSGEQKKHIITSFKKTFMLRSSSNLQSYINSLNLYENMRNNKNKELLFKKYNGMSSYLISLDNMFWYPYILRLIFTYVKSRNINLWKSKFSVENINLGEFKGLNLKPKSKKYKKTMIIFIGMGGILNPFNSIVDLLLNNDYQIIIPLYGPSMASMDYYIEGHEAEFHSEIVKYIKSINVKNFNIICWSLGGMLYKGFENYLKINNVECKDLNIIKVFLFEPLISIRSASDTYFLQIRTYSDTFELMNSITDKRYKIYNYIFCYFLHSIIGFSTCTSFGYLSNVELRSLKKLNYVRYLFLSSDDLIINDKLDKDLIQCNFDSNKIYKRMGYHGGWLFSKKLVPILKELI